MGNISPLTAQTIIHFPISTLRCSNDSILKSMHLQVHQGPCEGSSFLLERMPLLSVISPCGKEAIAILRPPSHPHPIRPSTDGRLRSETLRLQGGIRISVLRIRCAQFTLWKSLLQTKLPTNATPPGTKRRLSICKNTQAELGVHGLVAQLSVFTLLNRPLQRGRIKDYMFFDGHAVLHAESVNPVVFAVNAIDGCGGPPENVDQIA